MAKVTPENLGAWVLKCNPAVWDLEAYRADGETHIENWSVTENYRSDMMRPGQRVLLWVTGPRGGSLPRGFWASGWVTGPADHVAQFSNEEDEDNGGYWIDEEYRLKSTFMVPVNVELWDVPLLASDVEALPDVAAMELFKQPQMSNPSWISQAELNALMPLLPEFSEPPADDSVTIVIDGGSVGFGEPLVNAIVEIAGMDAVTADYETRGWLVEDVSGDKVGWDITCTSPKKEIHRVEVKGLSSRFPIVLLTANELRAAADEEGWRLAVVTEALREPVIRYIDAMSVTEAARPYVFKADFRSV